MTDTPGHGSVRCECGYDLAGLPESRPCPECGRPRPSFQGALSQGSLAREPHAVTLACLWRHAAASVAAALVGVVVLALAVGGAFMTWALALVAIPVAVSTYLRSSPRLVEPASRGQPGLRRLRMAARLGAVLLLVPGAWAISLASMGGTGWNTWVLAAAMPSLLVASAGTLASLTLDTWSGEDRATTSHSIAAWFWVACFVGLPIVLALAKLAGLTDAMNTSTDPLSLQRGSVLMGGLFVGVTGWWVLNLLGDAFLLYSLILCLIHKAQYNEIDARRHERALAAKMEQQERFEHLDDPRRRGEGISESKSGRG
ncbi:MAG: hypothetical protein MK085_00145 [Phycisphaerales bacterium]|nr:hypothetical protein [Phycisphaerales bacterium]